MTSHLNKKSALDTLLQAAVLAPSGDNTQPWRFIVDREQWSITINVDPLRDPSPMNAGQRMAWMAIGAAVENMLQTAETNGWQYELTPTESGPVHLKLTPNENVGRIPDVITARVTNRKVYDGVALQSGQMVALRGASEPFGAVRAHWFFEPGDIERFSELIARGDGLILGTKPIRDAFLAKVRFDQPANAVVDDGLSLGSIEATRMEQFMLRILRFVPDQLLRPMGGVKLFSEVAMKLARSASGYCIVSAADDSPRTQIDVGRVWQRCWLRATEQRLACQPMMSLCVLRNIRSHAPQFLEQIGAAQAVAVIQEMELLLDDLLKPQAITERILNPAFSTKLLGYPAAIMRVGNAALPSARTGRLV